jgi:hypothetical protein
MYSRNYDQIVKKYRKHMKSFTNLLKEVEMLRSLESMKNNYSNLLAKNSKQFLTRVRE